MWCKLAQRVCFTASDGQSDSRYLSCSQPSLHQHKTSLGDGAISAPDAYAYKLCLQIHF